MYKIFGGLVFTCNILPRISFCNGRQGSRPQSPTFHTCDRCGALKKTAQNEREFTK
jgi:hypothetical protein